MIKLCWIDLSICKIFTYVPEIMSNVGIDICAFNNNRLIRLSIIWLNVSNDT